MEIKITVVISIFVFINFTWIALMADRTDVKFNRMLKGQTLTTFVGMSLDQCWHNCEQRADCMSINYQQRIPVCELNYLAESGNLTNQTGSLYLEKTQQMDKVKCGFRICSGGEVCNIENSKCRKSECELFGGTVGTYVFGNKTATGSKARIGCKRGFMPSRGSDFSVTSVCQHGIWSKRIECIPLTCMRLAEAGVTVSNMYESYDAGSRENIDIFCEFNNGFRSYTGYTFLSPDTLNHLTNLSNHYTRLDHVMLRYVTGGDQFESKMEVLPNLRNLHNISILVNEESDSHQYLYGIEKPYLYMQFVPQRQTYAGEQDVGYSCNGLNFTLHSFHYRSMNHFVIYETAVFPYTSCQPYDDIGYGWKLCSTQVPKGRYIPDVVFFDWYQIQMGWNRVSNCEEYDVNGMAFGLPFDY